MASLSPGAKTTTLAICRLLARRNGRAVHLILLVLLALLISPSTTIEAQVEQPAGTWTPPVNISRSQGRSGVPVIAGDQTGRVHVVWGEMVDSQAPGFDTLSYSVIKDGHVSEPIDIIAVAGGDTAVPDSLAVTPEGNLVLAWRKNGELRVSVAAGNNAQSAKAWQTVLPDPNIAVFGSHITVDDSGTCHLIYTRNQNEIAYTVSQDGCLTWTDPSTITDLQDKSLAVTMPALARDLSGNLYATWTQTALSSNWLPVGVWFAQSDDGGNTWSAPLPIQQGAGYGESDVLVDDQQRVHLFWLGSSGIGGRYHTWSDKGGQNWQPPTVVAQPNEITGFPGRPQLLLDSARKVHAVAAGLGQNREQIWHSELSNGRWTAMQGISGELPDSESSAAAIVQGNQVYVIWNELDSSDIWYTTMNTGSPTKINTVVPSAPRATATTTAVAPARTRMQATVVPTSTVSLLVPAPDTSESPADQYPMPLIIGVVPAVILIAAVILTRRLRRG